MLPAESHWQDVLRKSAINLSGDPKKQGPYALSMAVAESGTSRFLDAVADTTPGVEQTLIDYVVPAGKTARLKHLAVSSKFESWYELRQNGAVIAAGRTSAVHCDAAFTFVPYREVSGQVQLVYRQRAESPVESVQAFLQITEV